MSESLQVPSALVREMVKHCESERPNEGCGLLASAGDVVVKVIRMSNASRSPVRYSLDKEEQFRAYKLIDEEGLSLGGVFHSHTHTEAYPSPTDVRLATEDVPYVIVSLAGDSTIRAFRILKQSWADDHGDIREIPVVVEG